MTRRRILACAFTCCPPGTPGFRGGEDVLGWNLLLQITKSHDTWVLTREEDRPSIEQKLQESPVPGLNFKFVKLPALLKLLLKFQGSHQLYYYIWQIKSYLVARKLHREIRFDLFHHITYANDWMVSFIGAFLPIPYMRGPGGGAHRTPKSLESEYTFGGRAWEKVRSCGQWLFRRDPLFVKGQNRAKAILVCNLDSMKAMPKKWSNKLHLFPVSGVTSEDLSIASEMRAGAGEFQIVSAGSLLRIKGFGIAIRAFKQFVDRYPSAKLTIVGAGPEENRLRRLIQQNDLEQKVALIGSLPREQLMKRIAKSDVLLFPSLRDGGGTVVIEAMSAAKPVICLDIGGPGLHVTEECGIKISPTLPDETVVNIANALIQLYQNDNLRSRLGQGAYRRARDSYHWDRLGEKLMEIYADVIES